jgi:hypothetical protein
LFAVSALETNWGTSRREDFWFIVAIRSEDEAEIRAGHYKLLKAVVEMDDGPLEAALEKLSDADIMLVEGVLPESDYRFKHALIQDAAYENLLKGRRQVLHRHSRDPTWPPYTDQYKLFVPLFQGLLAELQAGQDAEEALTRIDKALALASQTGERSSKVSDSFREQTDQTIIAVNQNPK